VKLIKEDIVRINNIINYNEKNIVNEQGFFDSIEKGLGYLKKGASTLDPHLVIPILSVGSFFIPVVGPFLSLGLEFADAALYWKEGNKEMAGLALAFTIIPFGELVRKIPAVRGKSIKWLTEAVEKGVDGRQLTKLEKQAVEEIIENKGKLSKLAKREVLKTAFKASKNLTDKIGLIYKMAKTYRGSGLLSAVIQIGGIYYSYYRLLQIFGFIPGMSEEDMERIQEELSESITPKQEEELANKVSDAFIDVPEDKQVEILTNIK